MIITVDASEVSTSCARWSLATSRQLVGSSHMSRRSPRGPRPATSARASERSCRSPAEKSHSAASVQLQREALNAGAHAE